MTYLVDTNILIEILFEQKEGSKCEQFLNNHIDHLFLSDFSLHSIGVILFRNQREELFEEFCNDVLPEISILSLPKGVYSEITSLVEKLNLDFDDAYQVLVAKEFDLKIVTLDKDFKRASKLVSIEFLS